MISTFKELKNASKSFPTPFCFHFSPIKNFSFIQQSGLMPFVSETAAPEVWFCTRSMLRWAWLHVVARHRAKALALYALRPPAKRKRRAKCVYTTSRAVRAIFVDFVQIGGLK